MHAFEKGEKHSRKNSKLDMIIIRCSNMKSAVVVVVVVMIVCVQQVFVEQQQGAGFLSWQQLSDLQVGNAYIHTHKLFFSMVSEFKCIEWNVVCVYVCNNIVLISSIFQ